MSEAFSRAETQGSTESRIASRLLAREVSLADLGRVQGKHYTKVYGIGEMGDWVEP